MLCNRYASLQHPFSKKRYILNYFITNFQKLQYFLYKNRGHPTNFVRNDLRGLFCFVFVVLLIGVVLGPELFEFCKSFLELFAVLDTDSGNERVHKAERCRKAVGIADDIALREKQLICEFRERRSYRICYSDYIRAALFGVSGGGKRVLEISRERYGNENIPSANNCFPSLLSIK